MSQSIISITNTLPNSAPFVCVEIRRTQKDLLFYSVRKYISPILKQAIMTHGFYPKYKCHITCQCSGSRFFHIIWTWAVPCPGHLKTVSVSNWSSIRKGIYRGMGSLVLLDHFTTPKLLRSQEHLLCGIPSLFLHGWQGEGVGCEATSQHKSELHWTLLCKHFSFDAADKQANTGGFICIS